MIQKTIFSNMIGLRNKTCKYASIAIITFFLSCNTHSTIQDINPVTFFNSNTYKKYLDKNDNPNKLKKEDLYLFNLIGEVDFLNALDYNFYVIYIFYSSKDSFYIYTMKSRDDVHLASLKSINELKTTVNLEKKADINLNCRFYADYKIIDKSDIQKFKVELDNATLKIKPALPESYNNPYRMFLYFDGKEYYRLNDQQINEKTLHELDTFFRNAIIFN